MADLKDTLNRDLYRYYPVEDLTTDQLHPGDFIPGVGTVEWVEKHGDDWYIDIVGYCPGLHDITPTWLWRNVEMRGKR